MDSTLQETQSLTFTKPSFPLPLVSYFKQRGPKAPVWLLSLAF